MPARFAFSYFNAKSLGESIRMLLAYGGEGFEDNRLTQEQWKKFKPNTVFGQMPVLEIDGKQYGQSIAISRYLGRKYGLAGDTLEQDLEIDMNVDFLTDIRNKGVNVYYLPDGEEKEKKQADNAKNVYPQLLAKLASIVEANNGHLALGKLTWADFVFAGSFDYMKTILRSPDLEEQYPIFKKVISSVLTHPKVKDYVDNMPEREYPF